MCCVREGRRTPESGNSECDIALAESRPPMDEFSAAEQDQERVRGMLHNSRESFGSALMDMQESMSNGDDCRELHDVVCQDLQDAGMRVSEAKRKADDVQDQVHIYRERCRGRYSGPPRKT